MREKPTPPSEGECCESGCEPCVWDFYYEDLEAWKKEQAEEEAAEKEAAEKKTD